jgi:glucose/arabinose dehydrogenase/regulation of enolase protein 1 (concanavalin A-like superfamily)
VVVTAWALIVASSLSSTPARAAPPDDFERTAVVTGLDQPTAFRFLPDGRILITEKSGAIKLYANGQVQPEPLVTLVVLQTDNEDERGLLGIEPDPDFAQNGYLYVSYTSASNHDRLSRITMTGNTVDPASEVVLFESDQPGGVFHHGGEIRFGPDGKIYWAMGMNTYNLNSQILSNAHGKILRLNKDGSAPADNPFVGTPDAVEQIWAYGLRNPFRFTFAPNGKLITGDVGGDAWEELNTIQKGGNYGWPQAEGMCDGCPYLNPVYAYRHTPPPAAAGSITSAMVYSGSAFPTQYRNKVFIADYTLGFIKYLTFDSEFSTFISEETFDDNAGTVVQLDQGPDDSIYQLNIYPGALYRIAPSGGNRAPRAVVDGDPQAGLSPLTVQFSSEGSSDPDGQPITYSWDFGDGTSSSDANPTKTYSADGVYTAALTVSDGEKTSTASTEITVGDRVPTATITSPADGAKYNAGDTVTLTGAGTDPEDGPLPGSAINWKVVFHHADHTHPFRDSITGESATITIPTSPDNGATTWYRVHMTVRDSAGLTDTKYVDIFPNLVTLRFLANFPDAKFTIDGVPKTGSHTETAVVGVKRVLDAPSPQYAGTSQYYFKSWSNDQPQTHTITTPAADTTYRVTFDELFPPPAPWISRDIGSPTLPGFSGYADGTFTIRGAGGDIWGPTDQFQYVYQPLSGDGEIVARVTSQTRTDDWAKSGVMIKESATAGADYALLAVTPANGITFQHNFDGESGSSPYTFPNAWLKLTRAGDLFTAYRSTDRDIWTKVGEARIDMADDVTIGLVVCSHKYDALNTSTFDNVTVRATAQGQWSNQDVGAPRLAGSATEANGVYTVKGAGDDIWGSADQFHYVSRPLVGDGQIVARLRSQDATTDGWAKAGIMIKESTTAGSPYALIATTPANGVNFQHSFNYSAGGDPYAFPNAWLKLKRIGSTFTGYLSADGENWSQVGSATIQMDPTATIGLFVTSHNSSLLSTATFDSIDVSNPSEPPGDTLPPPWANADVGAPSLAGSATHADGRFTLHGAGDDIWADTDQFHYVHQPLTADGEIIARVSNQDSDTDGWAKAGIMIKQDTTARSPYALLAVTPANGIAFQHDFNSSTSGGTYAFPNAWLRLIRVGNVITAYRSADGVSWTEVASVAVDITPNATIGLFVCSHNGSMLNTSVFDNVSVTR